jgi:hypothetical protein
MLVAFQGFPAPPGGKKTGAVMENVFVLGYKEYGHSKARRHRLGFSSLRLNSLT